MNSVSAVRLYLKKIQFLAVVVTVINLAKNVNRLSLPHGPSPNTIAKQKKIYFILKYIYQKKQAAAV